MTLDRDAARALFGMDSTSAPAVAGAAPFASTADTFGAEPAPYVPTQRRLARKGPDWRLIAPVAVALVCAGGVALFALPRDEAQPGRTVASTEIMAPPVAPPIAEPATAPTDAIATPVAETAPTARIERPVAKPTPARRAPARQVAVAPSAADAGVNASSTEVVTPAAPVPFQPTQPTTAAPTPVIPPEPIPPIVEPVPSLPVEPQ
jgi:hypothetical protein